MLRLEEWLRAVGFENGNPFAHKQADEEGRELQAYYIEHPAYSALRETDNPRSVVLYAPRGSGKSAARRMFEDYCIANATSLRPLMVSLMDWTWATESGQSIQTLKLRDYQEELFRQLVVAMADKQSQLSVKLPTDADLLGYARWLCTCYDQYLLPSSRQQLIDRGLLLAKDTPELAPYDLFQLRTKNRLAVVVNVIRALGFKTCYVVIDCLDELQQTTDDWMTGAQLLAPFIANLAMIETKGLVLRCFVPSEIVVVLQKANLLRTDRFECIALDWSGETGAELLHEILIARLSLFSNGHITSLDSLVVPELRNTDERLAAARHGYIDERLVMAARHSPRRLLNLGDLLFRACAASADSDNILISKEHLDQALQQNNSYLDPPHIDTLAVLSSFGGEPAAAFLLPDEHDQAAEPPSRMIAKETIPSIPLLELRSDGSIWRGSVVIEDWHELPVRQRQLLEYLYQHRGELCKKNEIIDHVWREYGLNDESALRKLAERLIEFLEPDPTHPVYLEKIRGGHYVLKNTVL